MEKEKINIYNDKKFNIDSLETILSIPNIEFNLLSKSDSQIKFRLDQDFFSYNFQSEELVQYPDYKNLFEDSEKRIIHSKENDVFDNDYGQSLQQILSKNDYSKIQNFELDEMDSFLVKPSVSIELSNRQLKISNYLLNDLSNGINQAISCHELKPIVNLTTSVVALAVCLFALGFKKEEDPNNETIKSLLKGLNENSLNIEDLRNDKFLNKKIPNLSNVLDNYEKLHFKGFDSKELSINEIVSDNKSLKLLTYTIDEVQSDLSKETKPGLFQNFNLSFDENLKFEQNNNTLAYYNEITDFIVSDPAMPKYKDKSLDEIRCSKLLLTSQNVEDPEAKNFFINKAAFLIVSKNLSFDSVNQLSEKIKEDFNLSQNQSQSIQIKR